MLWNRLIPIHRPVTTKNEARTPILRTCGIRQRIFGLGAYIREVSGRDPGL